MQPHQQLQRIVDDGLTSLVRTIQSELGDSMSKVAIILQLEQTGYPALAAECLREWGMDDD